MGVGSSSNNNFADSPRQHRPHHHRLASAACRQHRTLSPSLSSSSNDVLVGGNGRTSTTKFSRFFSPFQPKLLTSGCRRFKLSTSIVGKRCGDNSAACCNNGGRKKKFSSTSMMACVAGSSTSASVAPAGAVCNGGGGGGGGGVGGGGGKRARSRNRDHVRAFRELIGDWKLRDLHCLVVEFEASLASRELTLRADDARPSCTTVHDDLYRAFRDGSTCDVVLTYNNVDYAVHRFFLAKRCSFFRRLFRQHPTAKYRVPVNFDDYRNRLNSDSFALLLEYLYTGEISQESRQTFTASSFDLLLKFRDEIDVVRRLDDDLTYMYKNPEATGADAVLIFSSSNRTSAELNESLLENLPQTLSTEQQRNCRFKCHTSILAARSSFFRHLIEKRRQKDGKSPDTAVSPTASSLSSSWTKRNHNKAASSPPDLLEIVLDESVIPRQYAPVLINALYTDQIDMSLIIRGCVASTSCLTEVQAIASGKCQISPIDEATEIYQIARFLDFQKLAQGCEDVIVSHISLDSLAAVYNWSTECYGSAYVRRHCVNYLCQEFARVASTTVLFDLEESLLVDALKSDFVQASELEILNAVIRWGEHQLVRRLEEREPNILVGTTHSISRKGVRRSDLSDDELRDVLSNLIPLIRTDYVLPLGHPVIISAQSRGLVISRQQQQNDLTAGISHAKVRYSPEITNCDEYGVVKSGNRSSASPLIARRPPVEPQWTHTHHEESSITRPRFFLPYYETARTLLEKQLTENPEQLSSLINHHPPVLISNRVPDTLYMVNNILSCESSLSASSSHSDMTSEITVPDVETLTLMKQCVEQVLRTSGTVKRGLACGCTYHRRMVVKQVRLRVVREFGLNDCALAVLENSSKFYNYLLPERSSSHLENPLDYPSGYTNAAVSFRTCAPKRRFRSEPGLAQCDLTSSVSLEWPDLMASSSNCGSAEASCSNEYVSWSAEASSRLSVLETSWANTSVDSQPFGVTVEPTTTTTTTATQERYGGVKATSSAYQFVDLAAQINEFVEQSERHDDAPLPPPPPPPQPQPAPDLMPLDLTHNTTEQFRPRDA